ncbi:hypothetical protein COR50_03700 [Chitinophaga caeni]|uniref:Beta-lactamase class A catalytic domain-containing protein n=1 Tax=Chitinophaga caeni TaxID=2029983 RepID=A0A291QQR4_9BACT|nr:serine hydrolase [Chitinophaga caeni]ATL46349.1 hypothetical protein COR50_03700 [Chitinophaga caeni]
MKYYCSLLLLCTFLSNVRAQERNSKFLKQLIYEQASPALKHILAHPDSFQYQLIYTKIDRGRDNRPQLSNYYLNVDSTRYFNPASTVKLPTVLLALEKVHRLPVKGIDKYTTMLTDSGYSRQTEVAEDSSAEDGLPSIAQYARKVFLVSDNDAYNRLYEFVGQQTLNEGLWKKGYKNVRIVRRFVAMNEDENRHTNPVRFMKDGQLLYKQPPEVATVKYDFSRPVFFGKGHWDAQDHLIERPMDFTTHNNLPLQALQRLLQSVIFPETVPAWQRFELNDDDYRFLYQYMSELPSESAYPEYDTVEYFDSYTKFFLFKDGKRKLPLNIRVFNKTGWSYGFLTDAAYIVDFEHKVEFMLCGVIYVNRDGILNDNKYEYESLGYPFFREIGEIIYRYELSRKRKNEPRLDKFRCTYQ